jgi:hypothetical protein
VHLQLGEVTGWPGISESAAIQEAGSAVSVFPPGNKVGKLISAGLSRLVNESSPCRPPTINCKISTPFARNPNRPTPPTKPVTVPALFPLVFTAKLRGIILATPEMQPVLLHPSALTKLPSDEAPFSTLGSAYAVISVVGTASISPRPM